MELRKEIENRKDVNFLVHRFYQQIRANESLGPIFNQVVEDWDHHLIHLSDFWEMILLQSGPGRGKFNPVRVHRDVDSAIDYQIDQEHFGIWLALWFQTVDRYFVGDQAAYAKDHARRMAHMLFMRIWEARPK